MKNNAITPPPPERSNSKVKSVIGLLQVLLVAFFGVFVFSSSAQNNFQSDLSRNSRYYDSLLAIRGADSMQGTGYVQYQRWLRYWAPKLLPDKDYSDYQEELLEYAQNYVAPDQNTLEQSWHLIGPNGSGANFSDKFTGQIHYIYKNPNDQSGQNIFACSPVGGLFVSYDNGENWSNAGTDKGLPRSGVSSVVVDKYNHWYITTGNGESYLNKTIWQQSIGLYRSTDQGSSWKNIGLIEYNGDTIQNMRKVIDVSTGNATSLIVSTTQGLFRIDNANTTSPTFTRIINGEFYDVEKDITNSNIIYASGSGITGVYKVNLSDNTFLNLNFPFQDVIIPGAEINNQRITIETDQSTNTLYAIYTVYYKNNLGEFSFLYKYDSQNVWILRGQLPQSYNGEAFNGYARSLGWDLTKVNNQTVLIGCNVEPFRYITNVNGPGELTIVDLAEPNDDPHDDCHYILLDGNNKIWAGTDGGAIYGTFTGQKIEWQIKNKGLGVATVEYMDAFCSITGVSYTTSGQFDCGSYIYETSNEINWNPINKFGGDGYQTIIANDNLYFVSGQEGRIGIFENGNDEVVVPIEWTLKVDASCNPVVPNQNISYANWDTYFDYSVNYLYMTGQKEIRRLNLTTKVWEDWSDFENDPNMGCAKSGTWQIAVTGNNNNTMYVSTYGKVDDWYFQVYKSNGGGTNPWLLIKNIPSGVGWIDAIEPGQNSENDLYVALTVNVNEVNKYLIYYVNTSYPNNSQWVPINYGLDAGIINCIYYERNGFNRIWIGTEKGVYYKGENEQQWTNYTSNLPNVEVTSIKLENNKVYVGTYGRGVWFASAPGCGSGTDYTLNSDKIIPFGIQENYYGDVIIPSGRTLTVRGTLKMGSGCRIIVERGAKLEVDGGTITNACPDMWGGIEVWGTSNQDQLELYQGCVILKSRGAVNPTIEHAKIAINCIKTNVSGSFDATYSGGLIDAKNTTFLDNEKDVNFYPYPFSNGNILSFSSRSKFENCTFNSTDNIYYFTKTDIREHIHLEDIKDVQILGCAFTENTVLQYATDSVYGIRARDAGFIIGTDGNGKRCSFNGLDYGIKNVYTYYNLKTVQIDQTDFTDNHKSIYLSAINHAIITRNTFQLKLEFSRCGLYLDHCTGYQVEENEFFSNEGNPSNYKTVGLYINSSGYDNNEIYNNIFHKLPYATIAQGINRYATLAGLQIKCNDYSDNYTDISVTYGVPNPHNGIAYNQGSIDNSVTAPAGNRFSRTGPTYNDFNNQAGGIIYYLPSLGSVSNFPRLRPIYFTGITIVNNVFATNWNPTVGCPSKLTQHSIDELKSLVTSNQFSSETYLDSLNTLVDAGNTTALTLDVATSIPPETMQLRNELLEASPYLSDTVMVSAVEKEEVLPNSILTEVLTANPHSAKSEKLLNKLDERQTPPAENQMALIHANDTVLGHKEKLESGRAHYSTLQHQATGQLVRLYLKDSIQAGIADSIEQALSFIESPSALYQQAFCRFSKGDSLGVLNILDEVPTKYDLTQSEAELQSDYNDFFALLLELRAEGKNIEGVDSLQKNVLYTIMQHGDNQLQAWCRNILVRVDNLEYNEPYLFPEPLENKADEIKKPAANFATGSQSCFKLYPNPAKDYISIEYSLESGSGLFEIYSISGIRKHAFKAAMPQGIKTIDLRSWESGIYVIKLSSKGKLLHSEKFNKY